MQTLIPYASWTLMADSGCCDVIKGAGGLRKLRWSDKRRSKGKRGGLRIIYYYWVRNTEFWLFTLYDKDELTDLPPQRASIA